MEHKHQPRIVDFKLDIEMNWIPTSYDCLSCDWVGDTLPVEEDTSEEHNHREYVDGCFSCKIKTLQLSTGDANSGRQVSEKKWDSENEFYADAVRQGINPDGIFRHEVEAALEASEKLGVAYDTDTSPLEAAHITNEAVEVMREVVMEDKIISSTQNPQ